MTEDDFERVLREYGPSLRRLAASWERDPVAQEDLLQEILFALWRALPSFRGQCAERTFVFRVAHNRAITHRFKPRRTGDELDAASEVPDPRSTPEEAAMTAQQFTHLVRALQDLSVPMRQVLTLSLEGFDRSEIAEVLGITENNAGVRLSRARKQLQEVMKR